jgi:hypothetical protein
MSVGVVAAESKSAAGRRVPREELEAPGSMRRDAQTQQG